MRLVAYLRTSTDDKGQDPGRQRDVIETWAKRADHEVVAWVVDEGTSGAKDPFQRQHVLEAIKEAKAHGAAGLVVEAIDRWTRGGAEAMFVSRFFLRLDHSLSLKMANAPEGMPEEMQEAWDAMTAAAARAFRTRLREQIKSGLARARRKGWPNGRPGPKPKPVLTEDEVARIAAWKAAGTGWRRVALLLSQERGAFEFADPKLQRRHKVSDGWVRLRLAERVKSGCDVSRRLASDSGGLAGNLDDSAQPEASA